MQTPNLKYKFNNLTLIQQLSHEKIVTNVVKMHNDLESYLIYETIIVRYFELKGNI